MNIIKAKSDVIDNIVYLVTDAVGTPLVDRSESACAVFESFLSEGAVCYRVCGPVPAGYRPDKIEYFTRRSHQQGGAPWEACDGDGCRGEEMKFQEDTSTLCGQFRIWKGHGEHRDLMVKVTLAEPQRRAS